jgi:hypothetical protein
MHYSEVFMAEKLLITEAHFTDGFINLKYYSASISDIFLSNSRIQDTLKGAQHNM